MIFIIRVLIILTIGTLLNLISCFHAEELNVLGLAKITEQDFTNIMEIYKTFDRGYNLFRHNDYLQSYAEFKKKGNIISWIDGRRLHPYDVEVQQLYFTIQAELGTNFTEFWVMLFTKYMALVNAVKFIQGYEYFVSKKDSNKALLCEDLAYYLSSFGVHDNGKILFAIRRILTKIYPLAATDFDVFSAKLLELEKFFYPVTLHVHQQNPKIFETPEGLHSDPSVNTISSLGILWEKIEEVFAETKHGPDMKHVNWDTGFTEDMYRSNAVAVIRTAFTIEAQNYYLRKPHMRREQFYTLYYGCTKEFLLMDIYENFKRNTVMAMYEKKSYSHFLKDDY